MHFYRLQWAFREAFLQCLLALRNVQKIEPIFGMGSGSFFMFIHDDALRSSSVCVVFSVCRCVCRHRHVCETVTKNITENFRKAEDRERSEEWGGPGESVNLETSGGSVWDFRALWRRQAFHYLLVHILLVYLFKMKVAYYPNFVTWLI